jgi:hypothetical protein
MKQKIVAFRARMKAEFTAEANSAADNSPAGAGSQGVEL